MFNDFVFNNALHNSTLNASVPWHDACDVSWSDGERLSKDRRKHSRVNPYVRLAAAILAQYERDIKVKVCERHDTKWIKTLRDYVRDYCRTE